MTKSIESYLHKQAKELLYTHLKDSLCLIYKTDAGLIEKSPRVCNNGQIYLEVPVVLPYGDNSALAACKNYGTCRYPNEKWAESNWLCNGCGDLDRSNIIIHDIVGFRRMYEIAFAIEIVNKSYPKWIAKAQLKYPTYIIKAENILKRVTNSPVFVSQIIDKDFYKNIKCILGSTRAAGSKKIEYHRAVSLYCVVCKQKQSVPILPHACNCGHLISEGDFRGEEKDDYNKAIYYLKGTGGMQ